MKVLKIAFLTNMSTVSRLNGVFAKLRIWGVAGIKDYITKKVSWWRMVNRLRFSIENFNKERRGVFGKKQGIIHFKG
jgi:hypothetical protein